MNTIPEVLRVDKALAKNVLEWNDLFGTVKDEILCCLWQDSAQVFVMSTIYDLQTGTSKLRWCPKDNKLNSKIIRAVFETEVRTLTILFDIISLINSGIQTTNHSGPDE